MVKSVLSVSHQGLRDWIFQRLSALIIAIYSLGLIGYILFTPELQFGEWRALYALSWVKVATLLFVLALVYHAWIGMWSVFTDYVKNFKVRCFLHAGVLILLTACFLWAVMILWSV